MTLNEYQQQALETAIYPGRGQNLIYPALKLCGEAGEVAEKVGKALRDGAPADLRRLLVLELGDVLWYVAAMADEIGATLDEVAAANLTKLSSRAARGQLSGSGDER